MKWMFWEKQETGSVFLLTDLPEFYGSLKLLSRHYKQHCQVNAWIESGLQLKAFSIPTTYMQYKITFFNVMLECSGCYNTFKLGDSVFLLKWKFVPNP